jgi:hypothetical protein
MLAKVRCNSHLVFRDIRQEYNIPSYKMTVIYSGIRWRAMGDTFNRRETVAQELGKVTNRIP